MIVTIDTDKWTTPRVVRKRLNIKSSQVFENWILRGKIPSIYISELDLRLVGNIHSISELRKPQKKSKKS